MDGKEPKSKYPKLSFGLPKSMLDFVSQQAEQEDIKPSEFVRQCILLRMSFDPEFWNAIQRFSRDTTIPEWVIIQTWCAERMGKSAAEDHVWMERSVALKNLVVDFAAQFSEKNQEPSQKGTYRRVLDKAFNDGVKKLIHVRCENILKTTPVGGPLFERDRIFLDEFRSQIPERTYKIIIQNFGTEDEKRQLALEMEKERKRKEELINLGREARENLQIPEDLEIDDEELGLLYELVKNKRISEKGFLDQLEALKRNYVQWGDDDSTRYYPHRKKGKGKDEIV